MSFSERKPVSIALEKEDTHDSNSTDCKGEDGLVDSFCELCVDHEDTFFSLHSPRTVVSAGSWPSKKKSKSNSMDFSSDSLLSVPNTNLEQHVMMLKQSSAPYHDGFGREFELLESHQDNNSFLKSNMVDYRGDKNRYFNIIPYRHTHVPLLAGGDSSTKSEPYINANYIHGDIPGSHGRYICTQGPLAHTIPDFWSMIWQERAGVIVMLTKVVDGDRPKSAQYWPQKIGGAEKHGDFEVLLKGAFTSLSRDVCLRHLQLTNLLVNDPENASRGVIHVQYLGWPDHGVPDSSRGVRKVLHVADAHDQRICQERGENMLPMIVHCSAGIGRSGAFVALHATLERFRHQMHLPIPPAPHLEPISETKQRHSGLFSRLSHVFDPKPKDVRPDSQHDLGWINEEGSSRRSSENVKVTERQQTEEVGTTVVNIDDDDDEKKEVHTQNDFIFDLPKTVSRLRQQRCGMVQGVDQYRFVYEVLLDELKDVYSVKFFPE